MTKTQGWIIVGVLVIAIFLGVWGGDKYLSLLEKQDFVSCIQNAGSGASVWMICEITYPNLYSAWWSQYYPSLK